MSDTEQQFLLRQINGFKFEGTNEFISFIS